MNHTLAYQHLLDLNLTDAVAYTYGDAIGISWFYFIFVFLTIGIAYFKTKNIVYPFLITLIFLGVGWAYLPPEAGTALGLLSGVVIAVILYKLFSARGS